MPLIIAEAESEAMPAEVMEEPGPTISTHDPTLEKEDRASFCWVGGGQRAGAGCMSALQHIGSVLPWPQQKASHQPGRAHLVRGGDGDGLQVAGGALRARVGAVLVAGRSYDWDARIDELLGSIIQRSGARAARRGRRLQGVSNRSMMCRL